MSEAAFLSPVPGGVEVRLRVSPRASRDRIEGLWAGPDGRVALRVAVTAPPEGGKANDAVIRLLAKAWRLPKTSFSIRAGAGARSKTVLVAGEGARLLDHVRRLSEGVEP